MKRRIVVVLAASTLLLSGAMLEAKPKKKQRSAQRTEAVRDDWAGLVRAVYPLIATYRDVGPASMHVQLDGRVWNSLTYDQQQQICDVIASKQAVQSMHKTLHLFV